MYVCICKAVTENQIRAAVHEGASSLGELRQCLGVAGNCGTCAPTAEEILEEGRDQSMTAPLAVSAA